MGSAGGTLAVLRTKLQYLPERRGAAKVDVTEDGVFVHLGFPHPVKVDPAKSSEIAEKGQYRHSIVVPRGFLTDRVPSTC